MKSRFVFALCLLLVIPAVGNAQWADTGTTVSALQNNQRSVTMCSDGAGGAYLAWEDYRTDAASDIYAQRINSAGVPQWTANGVVVCNAAGSQWQPRMISDGAGGCVITWQDSRSGTFDVYAQRLNGLGSSLWTFNGVVVSNATGDQLEPTLCSDGGTGAIITWYDTRNPAPNGWDIYAQRITNGVVQWTANGVAMCTAAGDQWSQQITVDGLNGAIIVWQDLRAGSGTYDLWAQRVFGNGTVVWFANGVAVCQATNNQFFPVIASDGANGALIAWPDFRNGTDYDIYAQRLNLNGASLWTTNGAAICTASDYQSGVTVISDGQQGAYIAWSDRRNFATNDYDLYIQRVGVGGNPLWAPQGRAVATGPTGEELPMLTSDTANGVTVVFRAGSASTQGLWAQRLDNNGTLYWATNGVRISNNLYGSPVEPKTVADASGNVIAGWHTGLDANVYATRIDVRFGYWGKPEPTLFAAKDVPNDQGGRVRLEWYASSRDQLNQQAIEKYTIWRGIDQAMYANAIANGAREADGTDPTSNLSGRTVRRQRIQALDYFWELIGTQTAAYRFAYSFTAATTFDSTATNAATHRFQILAHGFNAGLDFINWPSNILAGRSVDNVAPPAPLFLTAQRIGNYVYLKWNGVHVPDLDKYTVYRKTSTGVTPIPANFLADDPDTLLTDSSAPTSALYYIVTATDIHQNQGAKSNEASVAATTNAGDLPPIAALTVLQNRPNPFANETRLEVGLPAKSDVHVEIFDVAGHRVRDALLPARAKGWNDLRLDARDDRGAPLPSGVYFYKVHAGAETVTRKMVIAR